METIARLPLDPDPERNTEWMYLPSDRAIPKLHLDSSAWVIVGLIQRFPPKGIFLAEKNVDQDRPMKTSTRQFWIKNALTLICFGMPRRNLISWHRTRHVTRGYY